jgi:levoglucosan dehydrogenase
MDKIGIGQIGYGMIGRVHALAYRELPLYYPGALASIELAAVCTARAETAQRAAAEAGFGAWTTEVKELVARDDVNVVDCCLPNYLHRETALAAIQAGKHVLVEKPLALNAREASEILQAANARGVKVGLIFNFRLIPALLRAKQLVDEGFLGTPSHFHFEYLHTGYQNPERPMGWKLRKAQCGGGSLVDLGSHLIDMVRYLLGDFDAVLATTHTYISERPARAGSTERERVDVDDAAWLQIKLASGAIGTLMTSRFATGAVDDLNFEIYGTRGALRFSQLDANWLYIYDQSQSGEPLGGRRGWTRLETLQNYAGAAAPPGRSIIGWTRAMAQNLFVFLQAVYNDREPSPGALDGVRVNQVLDAAYVSAASGKWEKVAG